MPVPEIPFTQLPQRVIEHIADRQNIFCTNRSPGRVSFWFSQHPERSNRVTYVVGPAITFRYQHYDIQDHETVYCSSDRILPVITNNPRLSIVKVIKNADT